jgi:hypothetical protein
VDGFQNQPNATPNLSCQGKGKKRSEVDGLAVHLIKKKTYPLGMRRSAASPRYDGGPRGRLIRRPRPSAPRLRPSVASRIERLVGLPRPPCGGSRVGHVDTALTTLVLPRGSVHRGPFLKENSFEKFQDLTFHVSFTATCNNLIKIGIILMQNILYFIIMVTK